MVKRQVNVIRVQRSLARLSKLPPPAFRVLLHGLATVYGWKIKKCARETGMSESTVKRALKLLLDLKYVTRENKADHPYWFRYRFYTSPVLMDHERPWYNGMMRINNGDISTVAIQEKIDSGEWRKPDN